jgi:hypothetical protein
VPRTHHHIVFFREARNHDWRPRLEDNRPFYQGAAPRASPLSKWMK